MFPRRWAPGLFSLLEYRRSDLGADARAGLAVAAVAIPVGIAYAQLAGFPPQIGLYCSLLPLVAYAVLGSSRQLILGPDAATCALIAASVAPMAGGDAGLYMALSGMLTLLTGVICIIASFLRLGALADFLSKPILVGFLNGIAITIVVGQVGELLGIKLESSGVVPVLLEIYARLGEVHLTTAVLAAGAFLCLFVSARFIPSLPSAVLAMVLTAGAVALFSLDEAGVKVLGAVPAGLPTLSIPMVRPDALPGLMASAFGLALVSFSSLMLTSRSFASRNRYTVDADQDLAALGVANIFASVSQGFAIAGADSRTATADSAGGRTHAAGLFAAAAVALVLMFFTHPLAYVPVAALGAVLIVAGLSLVDLTTLRFIFRVDRVEAGISILATVGVVALGAMEGILVAAVLAVLRFVRLSARPKVEILGRIPGVPGFHSRARHSEAKPVPGLLLLRFNGPLVFFNAGHFRHEVMAAVERMEQKPRAVVLDFLTVTDMDVTGLYTLREVHDLLEAQGIDLAGGGRQTQWSSWAEKRGFEVGRVKLFRTLHQAVRVLRDPKDKKPKAEETPPPVPEADGSPPPPS